MRATATLFRILPFVLILILSGLAAAPARAQTTVAGVTPGALAIDQSGQVNYSIPIDVPPGIAGMQPSLSLEYSSGGGNGVAGVGWSIGGLSAITRCPRTRVQDGQWGAIEYNDNDRFCLDGKRLVAINGGAYGADGTEYRTEIDGFFKIVSYGKVVGSTGLVGTSPVWFRVWTKTGQVMDYGATEESRIEARLVPVPPADAPPEVRAWAVSKIADTVGNYMTFTYHEDTANGVHGIVGIDYTHNDDLPGAAQSHVEFLYEGRPDIAQGFPMGSLITVNYRLQAIRTHTDGAPVRDYRLAYETGTATGRSRLTTVTECDGIDTAASCLTPIRFAWKTQPMGFTGFTLAPDFVPPEEANGLSAVEYVDVNGDGLVDLVRSADVGGVKYRRTWLNTGAGLEESLTDYITPFDVVGNGFGKGGGHFLDLDVDGLPDFIRATGGSSGGILSPPLNDVQEAWLNTGTGWVEDLAYKPPFIEFRKDSHEYCQDKRENICEPKTSHDHVYGEYIDLDGDGRPDFVQSYKDGATLYQGAWLNTGDGWAPSPAHLPPFLIGEAGKANVRYCDREGCNLTDVVFWEHRNGDFVDLNGDGLVDFVQAITISDKTPTRYEASITTGTFLNAWLNTGAGWVESPAHRPVKAVREYAIQRIEVRCDKDGACTYDYIDRLYQYASLFDVNGDALPDHVEAYGAVRNTWLNTGRGWLLHTPYNTPFPLWVNSVNKGIGSFTAPKSLVYVPGGLVDVNGDGLTDFVRASRDGTKGTPLPVYETWLNTGVGWVLDADYQAPFLVHSKTDGLGDFFDLNADGTLDFAEMAKGDNGVREAWVANSAAPDQLLSVTDSLGAATALSYAALTDLAAAVYEKYGDAVFPVLDIQAPIYVVSEVAADDGVGGQARTTYRYAGAKVDLTGRGFLGFRLMEATDQQAGIAAVTQHAQAFPFIGQVEAMATYIPDPTELTAGTILSRTTNTFSEKLLNAGDTRFPYVEQSIAESFEASHGHGNAAVTVSTTTTSYLGDDYGNPKEITVTTTGGGKTFTTVTKNNYNNDTVNWYLGRLTRATVTNTLPDTRSATRVSSFAYDPVTGLLTQEVVEPDIPALRLTTDYGYDAFGHITTTTVSGADIATRTTTTDYATTAPNFGRFATTATNALGHTETRTHDPRFGAVTSVTGPNGITTRWQYDGFGRKIREDRADGTATVISIEFCLSGITVTCPAGGAYVVGSQNVIAGIPPAPDVPYEAGRTQMFDTLNRVVRSVTRGFDNQSIIADTVYNALGQVEKASRPYFYLAPEKYWTFTTYDAIGRVESVTTPAMTREDPDIGVEYLAYNGLETIATNAKGQISKRLQNAIGQLVEAIDNDGNRVLSGYDPFDNLERTEVLPAGAVAGTGIVTAMTYDIRGRKKTMDDPDMGVWQYDYNVLGELVSQTDAKGQTVTTTYDLLGRVETRSEAEGTTSWTYDSAVKTAAIGKPDRVFRSEDDYVEDYVYDTLGRPFETVVTYGGRSYAATTGYDPDTGRVKTVTYPAAADGSRFAVENTYTETGYLESVQEPGGLGAVYWRALLVNADGQVEEEELGNGLITRRGFDPAKGLAQTIRVYDGLDAIQDNAYEFDHLGNLEWRIDNRLNRKEAFGYDSLNRMTSATLTDMVTQATLHVSSTGYDPHGNITFKSDVGGYEYDSPLAGPHAVNKAGNVDYAYDANGAMISATFADTGTSLRSFTWSSFNKPVRIEGAGGILASEFVYGPSRARVRQTIFEGAAVTKTITYLGAFERHETPGAADELVHYIAAGGTVAIFTKVDDSNPATDRIRYLHKDHLGSVSLITDAAGLVVESRSFDAWGRARNADWSAAGADIPLIETKRGFTGHEHLDTVGLIHMNGRVYDPVIGRFVSADPFVQAPTNTQSHNRYTYVINNPLSLIDPSGFGWLSKIWKKIRNFFSKIGKFFRKHAMTILKFAAKWACAGNPVCLIALPALFAGAQTALMGGNLGDILASALVNGSMSAMSAGINAHFEDLAAFGPLSVTHRLGQVFSRGVMAGIQAGANGGNAVKGFINSVFGQASSWFVGQFPGKIARNIGTGVAAGASAVLGGGKFINGVLSTAFKRLRSAMLGDLRKSLPNLIKNLKFSPSLLVDVVGKVWASPYTAIGLVYGTVDYALGLFLGMRPQVQFGNNAIEFTGGPLQSFFGGAITLGNVISYSANSGPDTFGAYKDPNVLLGRHEKAHTYQYQLLGPLFFPVYMAAGGFSGLSNPFERQANLYGDIIGHHNVHGPSRSWWPG